MPVAQPLLAADIDEIARFLPRRDIPMQHENAVLPGTFVK